MNRAGIDKARRRLDSAKASYEMVRHARNWSEFEPAWVSFLIQSNAIFEILKAASHGSPKGGPWIGRKQNERGDDELLCYMHHARNAEQHGIKPVAQDLPSIALPVAPERGKIVSLTVQNGMPVSARFIGDSGAELNMTFSPGKPRLVSVIDRGKKYDPPNLHLGKQIERGDPYAAGSAFLLYLEKLINCSESFAQQ